MKRLFIALAYILILLPLSAQKTYYYKMVKKCEKGVESTDVSGGQFVTFYPNMCFESTRDGYGIGHGTLKLVSKTNEAIVYRGMSYWDNTTVFKFLNNNSKMLVITASGDQYGYVYTTAPNTATTCSLIRKNKPVQSSGIDVPVPINNDFVNENVKPQNNRNTTVQKKVRPCRACNGVGSIKKSIGTVAGYGLDNSKWYCAECGTSFSRRHTHQRCTNCNGTGQVVY